MIRISHPDTFPFSPAIEWAVRAALVPRFESQGPSTSTDLLSSTEHTMASSYPSALADPNEPSLAVYHLRPSALDRIQEFLVRGERRQAYHYALDERLWAHAMLIASSVDTQAWREVVNEFLHSELSIKPSPRPLPGSQVEGTVIPSNGRESLRVAYSLFAGHGAAAGKWPLSSIILV
jgi:COPII coat assembly protein SEC16